MKDPSSYALPITTCDVDELLTYVGRQHVPGSLDRDQLAKDLIDATEYYFQRKAWYPKATVAARQAKLKAWKLKLQQIETCFGPVGSGRRAMSKKDMLLIFDVAKEYLLENGAPRPELTSQNAEEMFGRVRDGIRLFVDVVDAYLSAQSDFARLDKTGFGAIRYMGRIEYSVALREPVNHTPEVEFIRFLIPAMYKQHFGEPVRLSKGPSVRFALGVLRMIGASNYTENSVISSWDERRRGARVTSA